MTQCRLRNHSKWHQLPIRDLLVRSYGTTQQAGFQSTMSASPEARAIAHLSLMSVGAVRRASPLDKSMREMTSSCASARPTAFPDVNSVLATLVAKISERLEDNFVGAYLHGSLAVGDFNSSSGIDVIVVIQRDLRQSEIAAFQDLHRALFAELPTPWGQRIELSYAPADILCRWSLTPRDPPDFPRSADWRDPSTASPPRSYPLWYLDNGCQELVRSEHDNTRVVRWVIREKGITLAGPAPSALIEPVSSQDLALELYDMLRLINDEWSTAEAIGQAWTQAFFVTLCCRALHTPEMGEVTSKRAATEWASTHIEDTWRGLIETAWSRWRDARATLSGPADPLAVQQTIELMRHTSRSPVEPRTELD
jgi:hypothetical protein